MSAFGPYRSTGAASTESLPLRLTNVRSTRALARAKAGQGQTISVCIPARDEEQTIGPIVAAIRAELVERVPLVDEIVVVDDGSRDQTAGEARRAGATVHAVETLLPELTGGSGKGEALWKALYASAGSVICYLDGDVRNFEAHFVTRLVAPLLEQPETIMVKGYYRRPMADAPDGGGRVTELVARPLLSRLFPALTGFVQPLAGEYAVRRDALESLPFVEGWGVDLGLLVDAVTRYGVAAVGQADLGVREHRNRPLDDLGPQALAVLVVALRRAGVDPRTVEEAAELVRFDDAMRVERVPVEVRERPPMLTVPAYRAKFGRELSA